MVSHGIENHTFVITSANGRVGRDLVRRLRTIGARTIALIRKPDPTLEADDIIEDWLNNPKALDALRSADVVVHLSGELFIRGAAAFDAAFIKTTERVIAGLDPKRAQRLIALSYIGADAGSRNLYLRANGQREQMLQATGKPVVIFRCPAILNTPADPDGTSEAYTAKNGSAVQTVGDGTQKWQAVYREDVIEAIVAASTRGKPGVYDLVGPTVFSVDELVRLINRTNTVQIAHTPPWMARIASLFVADLPPTAVDIALRDAVGDSRPVSQEFGVQLTDLRTIWTSS